MTIPRDDQVVPPGGATAIVVLFAQSTTSVYEITMGDVHLVRRICRLSAIPGTCSILIRDDSMMTLPNLNESTVDLVRCLLARMGITPVHQAAAAPTAMSSRDHRTIMRALGRRLSIQRIASDLNRHPNEILAYIGSRAELSNLLSHYTVRPPANAHAIFSTPASDFESPTRSESSAPP